MPKRKLKIKRSFLRPIHIQAAAVLVAYHFISNFIFVSSVYHPIIYVSFLVPFIFGLISTFTFLYLFGHRDFFHFIKKLEREEKGTEEKYLGKFSHYGKVVVCVLVGATAGPVLLALTIRFLFPKSENRYLFAFISILISTVITVTFAKGFFRFLVQ